MRHKTLVGECCAHGSFAAGLAALAHPARIEIIRCLSGLDGCCCKDMVNHLHLAQSTVSQHLKVLVGAGILHMRPEGKTSRYEVDAEVLAALSRSLAELSEACSSVRKREVAPIG